MTEDDDETSPVVEDSGSTATGSTDSPADDLSTLSDSVSEDSLTPADSSHSSTAGASAGLDTPASHPMQDWSRNKTVWGLSGVIVVIVLGLYLSTLMMPACDLSPGSPGLVVTISAPSDSDLTGIEFYVYRGGWNVSSEPAVVSCSQNLSAGLAAGQSVECLMFTGTETTATFDFVLSAEGQEQIEARKRIKAPELCHELDQPYSLSLAF